MMDVLLEKVKKVFGKEDDVADTAEMMLLIIESIVEQMYLLFCPLCFFYVFFLFCFFFFYVFIFDSFAYISARTQRCTLIKRLGKLPKAGRW